MTLKEGQVVVSCAGRDKGTLLVVTAITEHGVLVCDGKARPLERPKRKNPRHLIPAEKTLDPPARATNRRLKRALREMKIQ
jgi:ribosomal protein L14E/L6E/L27E